MKKLAGAVCTALLAMGVCASPAWAADAKATLPTFPVTLNGVVMEQQYAQYPLLVYKDITYVPMTWADTRLLGLTTTYSQAEGLHVLKGGQAQTTYQPYTTTEANGTTHVATIATGPIRVNGKVIDNQNEEYPLLLYRDITYFPLTWRFAVNEFGWDYTFDMTNGLVITPKVEPVKVPTDTTSDIVGKKVVVNATDVYLREAAGTGSEAIGMVQKGMELVVLGTHTVDDQVWYQVTGVNGGDTMWIAGWLTKVAEDQSVTIDSNNGVKVGSEIVVNANSVNLRESPVNGAVQGMVNQGTRFTVLSIREVNGADWYQVSTADGKKVWIASWLTVLATTYENILLSGDSVSVGQLTQLEIVSVAESQKKTVLKILHGAGNVVNTLRVEKTSTTLVLDNVYLKGSVNGQYSAGPLQAITAQQSSDTVVQLELTLENGAYCAISQEDDMLVITVYSQQSHSSNVLADKLIVVDPGHGVDPGAIGPVLGVTDAEVGLEVGLKLRDLLEAQGATVIMTRENDARVPLNDRPALANQVEADLFISIHGNANNNATKRGIETYYYAPSTNAHLYAQNVVRSSLAQQVSDALGMVTGQPSEVRKANYAVLRENNHPSILVETGYLSNAEDEALLATDTYRRQLAEGIFIGVLNYFNQY